MITTSLSALAAIECRFDGPIPEWEMPKQPGSDLRDAELALRAAQEHLADDVNAYLMRWKDRTLTPERAETLAWHLRKIAKARRRVAGLRPPLKLSKAA